MIRTPFFYVATALILSSCATQVDTAKLPFQNAPEVKPVTELSEDELKGWAHSNIAQSNAPGMNLTAAYDLLKGLKPTPVIVGVIDSGVDFLHEDLQSVMWVNPKEIPDNKIDDDKNGYIDDIHGWNFLGNINEENMEITRILRKGEKNNPDYQRALDKYNKEYNEAKEGFDLMNNIHQSVQTADVFIKTKLGKVDYSAEDLKNINTSEQLAFQSVRLMERMFGRYSSVNEALKEIEEGQKHYHTKLNFHLNKELNVRKQFLNDNPEDINDRNYGDNNVMGPSADGALHGTHVAGIIGAVRGNNIGMDGVADAVRIMSIRAVPDGDEYDKDIALAIRYAADNGAKVINASFGKAFSPNVKWVQDAIKYAASKDVLFVHAAGNDTKNIDTNFNFPDDNTNGKEFTDNFISIGALNYEYSENLMANFSNYGQKNVDLFAPGVQIYATAPNNTYKFLDGTSMAAPEVAGLAALIRSYFPKLKAKEVKQILMLSGMTPKVSQVIIKADQEDKKPFNTLSKTGKIANAYNAILLARAWNAKK